MFQLVESTEGTPKTQVLTRSILNSPPRQIRFGEQFEKGMRLKMRTKIRSLSFVCMYAYVCSLYVCIFVY